MQQRQRQQREPRRSGHRRPDRSVGAAFPKAAATTALWELPRPHSAALLLTFNCGRALALVNARKTAHFAFLEIGMRNELPEEFGNEKRER